MYAQSEVQVLLNEFRVCETLSCLVVRASSFKFDKLETTPALKNVRPVPVMMMMPGLIASDQRSNRDGPALFSSFTAIGSRQH